MADRIDLLDTIGSYLIMMRVLFSLAVCLPLVLALGCGGGPELEPVSVVAGGHTGGASTGGVGTGSSGSGSGTGGCDETCGGKQCGSNGCGGFCGICGSGTACTPAGTCESVKCQQKCQGKECGPDGCGGFCGICEQGKACNGAGVCSGGDGDCTPNCAGKQCGDDGCGNLCGKCAPGKVCIDEKGECTLTDNACGTIDEVGECQQQDTVAVTCKAGKLVAVVCNPHKGLVCGYNETKNKHDCIKVACNPNCNGKACGSDGCGGQCGQCNPTEVCSSQGLCTQSNVCAPNCQGKVCGPDGCGGACGICGAAELCSQGECIDPNACDADCTGKSCGADGCGGTCGTCLPSQSCTWGECIESACTPNCVGKNCGGDGCGGICGDCPVVQNCDSQAHCVTVGGGNCGNLSFEGTCVQDDKIIKWCEGDQIKTQDCTAFGEGFQCSWIDSQETYWCTNKCQAACNNKECGDDGCGNSCGACGPEMSCNGTGQCVPAGGGGECGEVSAKGVCEGTTLKYCVLETLQFINCGQFGKLCGWIPALDWNGCKDPGPGECAPNCLLADESAKECGDDGCGNLCGICGDGEGCDAGKCGAGGGANECGEVTNDGACEGDLLKFCVSGSLFTVDCAQSGQTCGDESDSGYFDCLDPDDVNANPSTCGGIAKQGQCNENTVLYCVDEDLDTIDCTQFGLFCMWSPTADSGNGSYDCLADPGCVGQCEANQKCQHDGDCGCDNITLGGVCEEQTLVWCNVGTLVITDCTSDDGTCNIDNSGWASCL